MKSVIHYFIHSFIYSVSQSVSQSGRQSVSQSGRQAVSQSVSQSVCDLMEAKEKNNNPLKMNITYTTRKIPPVLSDFQNAPNRPSCILLEVSVFLLCDAVSHRSRSDESYKGLRKPKNSHNMYTPYIFPVSIHTPDA
jgi:hypothetical protein